jgi:hypothetical protein
MTHLENNLARAEQFAQRKPLAISEERFLVADALTCDEVTVIRGFFELIASWEVEEAEHGNRD